MKLGDCEVWIACDGKPLPEYAVALEGDGGKQTACFIPSEAGKKFVIHFRNNSRKDILSFAKRLDGTSDGSNWYPPGESGECWGTRVTPTTRRSYQFSHLTTTDDDSSLDQNGNSELGTIRIQVYRVKRVPRTQPVGPACNAAYNPVGPVHERSKKAGVHCISLGEESQIKPKLRHRKIIKINPHEGPVATFIFRYRPLALLQAQEIVPLPDSQRDAGPEAGPSQHSASANDSGERQRSTEESRPAKRARLDAEEVDVKPDIANMSDDADSDGNELNELKGQLQQILSRIDRMEKKKSTRKSTGGSGRVKKEEPRGGTSSGLGSGGGVIDLTLSD
ncbi:hypothetical protein C8T65DRAFT_662092 [Cerioporus squamosus]|nr:hypothetical protein C8T65DRAFT_662092 [Cerioporus squamosus]